MIGFKVLTAEVYVDFNATIRAADRRDENVGDVDGRKK